MVGLIPLFAVETLEPELLDCLPAFKKRLEWFVAHRPDLDGQRGLHAHARRVGTAAARDRRSRSPEAGAEDHARRERVPVAVRHPGALAGFTMRTYVLHVDDTDHRGRLRTR